MITPIKPITTAVHLLTPTFSRKKIAAVAVTINGVVISKVYTFAIGMRINAIKKKNAVKPSNKPL